MKRGAGIAFEAIRQLMVPPTREKKPIGFGQGF